MPRVKLSSSRNFGPFRGEADLCGIAEYSDESES